MSVNCTSCEFGRNGIKSFLNSFNKSVIIRNNNYWKATSAGPQPLVEKIFSSEQNDKMSDDDERPRKRRKSRKKALRSESEDEKVYVPTGKTFKLKLNVNDAQDKIKLVVEMKIKYGETLFYCNIGQRMYRVYFKILCSMYRVLVSF